MLSLVRRKDVRICRTSLDWPTTRWLWQTDQSTFLAARQETETYRTLCTYLIQKRKNLRKSRHMGSHILNVMVTLCTIFQKTTCCSSMEVVMTCSRHHFWTRYRCSTSVCPCGLESTKGESNKYGKNKQNSKESDFVLQAATAHKTWFISMEAPIWRGTATQ